jgi:hypothetical protein
MRSSVRSRLAPPYFQSLAGDGVRGLPFCVVVCVVTACFTPRSSPFCLLSRERVERSSFRLNPHVGVVRQHLRRDLPRNCHDGAVTGLRLGKLGDRMVSQIMGAVWNGTTTAVRSIRKQSYKVRLRGEGQPFFILPTPCSYVLTESWTGSWSIHLNACMGRKHSLNELPHSGESRTIFAREARSPHSANTRARKPSRGPRWGSTGRAQAGCFDALFLGEGTITSASARPSKTHSSIAPLPSPRPFDPTLGQAT